MKTLLAIFSGLSIGIIIFFCIPSIVKFLISYFDKIRQKCDKVLSELNLDVPKWQRSLFYVIGPVVSTILAIILFKPIWLKILVASALSLLTRNISYNISLYLKNRRINRIKTQLVDALGLIANTLKSGLSLQQGFQMAAEEMPPPISQEFGIIVSSQRLGKSFDQALEEFQHRIPLEEVDLLISSLVILRETGGNIIETLDIIIHTIGEEQRVKSKIKTVTTQGIAQAVVISALPFFLAGALYVISPEYIEPLLNHPIGWGMIAFMLLLQGIGMWMMKKIVSIKV